MTLSLSLSLCPSLPPAIIVAGFFYLRGRTYTNGTRIRLGSVGHGDEAALIIKTENPNCCKSQRLGECYYPNGDLVRVRAAGDQLYRNRGKQLIRLNRQGCSSSSRQAPIGLYCCIVPDKEHRVCVNIIH